MGGHTLTLSRVRDLLHYDPETGEVFSRSLGRRVGYDIEGGRYRRVRVPGSRTAYYEHRLIWFWMTGTWPEEVDHINGDRCDNRWSNLREASRGQNACNRSKQRNNSTGYKNVIRVNNCPNKPYRAYIRLCGRSIHLGYFSTPEEANEAYWAAAQKHFGEFARKE